MKNTKTKLMNLEQKTLISLSFGMILTVLLLLPLSGTAFSQDSAKFENLKIFPKDISKDELIGEMRQFAFALGVRCKYCHAKDTAEGARGLNHASDDKPQKRNARLMLEMVKSINNSHTPKLDLESDERVKVECITCHRGQLKPRMIGDVLMATHSDQGIDSMFANYDQLREKYYGTHTYDFSETVLNEIGRNLSIADNSPDAIRVFQKNLEYFPESAYIHYNLAFAYLDTGDSAKAMSNLEKSVELEPQTSWYKDQLKKMKGE